MEAVVKSIGEADLAIAKMDRMEAEVRAGKRKLVPLSEVLKKYE